MSGSLCHIPLRSFLIGTVFVLTCLSAHAEQSQARVDDLKKSNFFTKVEGSSTPVTFSKFIPDALRFEKPVWMSQIPNTKSQFVVLEHRSGKAFRIFSDAKGEFQKELFGDFSDSVSDGPWEGLMCLAFHPDFTQNRRYFLKHETIRDGQRWTIIVERFADADLLHDSGQPSKEFLAIKQPADNHNGGTLMFGPDGYLYFAMGDGGPQEDPNGYSQSLYSLLGKMHRIDVNQPSNGLPYSIPNDNPFSGSTDLKVRQEIWATGLREPWRFSFDRLTGDLWVGDVGQGKYEEATIVKKGENHGWNVYESFEPFSDQYRVEGSEFSWPVFVYSRHLGNSITGGYVYRGNKASPYYGAYICADFTTRRTFAIWQKDGRTTKANQIGLAPSPPSSFAEGLDGKVYLIGYDGLIYAVDLD
jgi:glucose/arabinose dehydrogenase